MAVDADKVLHDLPDVRDLLREGAKAWAGRVCSLDRRTGGRLDKWAVGDVRHPGGSRRRRGRGRGRTGRRRGGRRKGWKGAWCW